MSGRFYNKGDNKRNTIANPMISISMVHGTLNFNRQAVDHLGLRDRPFIQFQNSEEHGWLLCISNKDDVLAFEVRKRRDYQMIMTCKVLARDIVADFFRGKEGRSKYNVFIETGMDPIISPQFISYKLKTNER